MLCLAPAEQGEKQRNEQGGDESRDQHAAEHARAHGAARRRPAPVASARGRTPNMKASEVITIGLKRWRAASIAAVVASIPASTFCTANSTIRMAFFAANPISVTNPIWK